MNLAQVFRILAGFTLFFTLLELIPLGVALFETPRPDIDAVAGFAGGIGVGLALVVLLGIGSRTRRTEFFRREALAAVGLAWLLASALGAVPFVWSQSVPTAADAWFETMSGLCTCGASVFNATHTPAVEALPDSILLWRAQLQWTGGLGIILMFLVLLPAMGVTGRSLLVTEQTGIANDRELPRMQDQARLLFRVYFTLTAATIGALLLAGMTPLDAVCHAFASLSTGGYSNKNLSIGQYQSVTVELILIGAMFLGAANFALLHETWRSRFRRPLTLLASDEFKTYVGFAAAMVVAVAAILWAQGGRLEDPALHLVRDYGDPLRCLRDAAFQVVSVLSSTGFASANFQNWPVATLLLLVVCMITGGCSGSTTGGLKVIRLLVVAKLIAFSIRRFVRPRAVEKMKVDGEVILDTQIAAIVAVVQLWLLFLVVGTLVLVIDPRLDLFTAFTANATCMSCAGPAITAVLPQPDGAFALANAGGLDLGPYGSFGDLYSWQKVLLSLQMLFGRLEILTLWMLFMPSFWRR